MLLLRASNLDHVTKTNVSTLKLYTMKNDDHWRIDMARELLNVKDGNAVVMNFDGNELENILEIVCVT